MSLKNVKAFFEKVEEDRNLQKKLKSLGIKARSNRGKELTELLKIAAAAGYRFTLADFAKARAKTSKLSRSELLNVARRLEQMSTCGWPPCGTGGEAFTCPRPTW